MSQIDPPSPSQQPGSAPASTPPTQAGEVSGVPNLSADEIEKGKVLAIISYIFPIIAIVPVFITKDNRFSMYHGKQSLTVFIFVIPMAILSVIPLLGCVIAPVMMIGCIACMIIGIINVVNGRAKPLPVIGPLGAKWLASIDVKPAGAGPSTPPPSGS